jgi:hypothetical protein
MEMNFLIVSTIIKTILYLNNIIKPKYVTIVALYHIFFLSSILKHGIINILLLNFI